MHYSRYTIVIICLLINSGFEHVFLSDIPHDVSWFKTFKQTNQQINTADWFNKTCEKVSLSDYIC